MNLKNPEPITEYVIHTPRSGEFHIYLLKFCLPTAGAFSVGQFACGQNIKKVNCFSWGPAGKKVHICCLLPTSVSTKVQIVQTLCEGRR